MTFDEFITELAAAIDPDGSHKHKCNHCQHVWEHSNQCAGDKQAHTCQKCGEEQWYKYRGHLQPGE